MFQLPKRLGPFYCPLFQLFCRRLSNNHRKANSQQFLTNKLIASYSFQLFTFDFYFRDFTTGRHLFIIKPFVQVHLVLIAIQLYLFSKKYFIKLFFKQRQQVNFKYERFCCLAIFIIHRFLYVQGENLQLDSALLSVETATR